MIVHCELCDYVGDFSDDITERELRIYGDLHVFGRNVDRSLYCICDTCFRKKGFGLGIIPKKPTKPIMPILYREI